LFSPTVERYNCLAASVIFAPLTGCPRQGTNAACHQHRPLYTYAKYR